MFEPHHFEPNETRHIFDEWGLLASRMGAPAVVGLPPYTVDGDVDGRLPDPEPVPQRPPERKPAHVPGGARTTYAFVIAPAIIGVTAAARRRLGPTDDAERE